MLFRAVSSKIKPVQCSNDPTASSQNTIAVAAFVVVPDVDMTPRVKIVFLVLQKALSQILVVLHSCQDHREIAQLQT